MTDKVGRMKAQIRLTLETLRELQNLGHGENDVDEEARMARSF